MERLRRYIQEENLDTKSRKRELVYQRFYIYKYLKEENSHNSLAWIGQEFGRDHATVIHGLREYEKYKDDRLFLEYTKQVRELFPMGEESTGVTHSTLMFQILAQQNRRLVVI